MFYNYYGDKNDLLKMIHNLMNPDGVLHHPQTGRRGVSPEMPRETVVCPECQQSRKELYQTGKIGCSVCVDTFRADLESIVQHIQGRYKFSGRVPEALAGEIRITIEEVRQQLAEAVAEERYEDAAVLRDIIKQEESRQ